MVDDDEVGIEEAEVSGTQDDKRAMKSTKDDATMPPKENEPKVDFKTLSFSQRYVRRNLDKKFGKFLDYLKELAITMPFVEAITDMPA